MRSTEFNWFRTFLEQQSGIIISEDKLYLVQSRLKPLLRQHQISDLNQLAKHIKYHASSDISQQAIDAMTTNETLFFRDQYPYDALETLVFPELSHAKGISSPIHIWSAAASRGQEAYSIAIAANESIAQAQKRVRILGTDLSPTAIAYAKAAIYSQMEVQRGMPVTRLVRFFSQQGTHWHVAKDIKNMVQFETANLTEDKLVSQVRRFGPFDVVFLRNVLIYFSAEERKKVIDRIARSMRKGGYLITGATETPEGLNSKWEAVLFKGKRLWKLQ
ncbi:MAG: protein-glutamate O-methyltransferase CheR [Mariprofundaceae bacterium]|nr:protein-glutamate O-methyltransferase CheR [Mariprofundaceae bacterium]